MTRRNARTLVLALGMVASALSTPIGLVSAQTHEGLHEGDSQDQMTLDAALLAFASAMRAGDWATCARLAHPDLLATTHEIVVLLSGQEDTGARTLAMLNVATVDEARDLDPAFVFERFFAHSIADAGAEPQLATLAVDVLGTVPDGLLAHVVFRYRITLRPGREPIELVGLETFGVHEGRWLAQMDGALLELVGLVTDRGRP
jgi:hypothetical protein